MLITGVCTLHVGNGVIRTETSEGVDMTVCIVARKIAMI